MHTLTMTMSPSKMSIPLLFVLLTLVSTSALPTVHEVLQQYGLPIGLLPDSVTSYTMDEETSTFVIYLDKPCYVKFDYLVYFDTEITGKISYGQITEVKGSKAQAFMFWLDIVEIKADSTSVYMGLGFMNVKLDIAQFETIPSCTDNALAACHGSKSSKPVSQLPLTAEQADRAIME